MANSKLLKDAIADAKAVRETAIANAKIALEEAFTPRLQSMFAAKLAEAMDEDEEKKPMEEMMGDADAVEEAKAKEAKIIHKVNYTWENVSAKTDDSYTVKYPNIPRPPKVKIKRPNLWQQLENWLQS